MIFGTSIFLKQLVIKWLFNFPPYPTSVSTLPGENRTNEICTEMNNKRNQLEIRSHKNLITVVWANEVRRLLSYYSTSCYQTCRWWHVCVSVGQCTSASTCKMIELLEHKTPDFISPGLWPPTALTSIWSITSSGGSCNSGSIRRHSRMWMNSWTREATGWNRIGLEQNIIDTAINAWRNRLCAVFAQRADI